MKRINPLQKVEARLDIEEHGLCPICKSNNVEYSMPIVTAAGVPTYVCVEHCVSLPVEDTNPVYTNGL
jgi:hypothetical protein